MLGDDAFAGLVAAIVSSHRTFAPVVRDASVVIDEVRGVGDLARGVTLEQSPGSCRLHPLAED